MSDEKPHTSGQVDPGDTGTRVGAEVVRERGCDPGELCEKFVDIIGAEFTTCQASSKPSNGDRF